MRSGMEVLAARVEWSTGSDDPTGPAGLSPPEPVAAVRFAAPAAKATRGVRRALSFCSPVLSPWSASSMVHSFGWVSRTKGRTVSGKIARSRSKPSPATDT